MLRLSYLLLSVFIGTSWALLSFPTKPRVFVLSDIANEPDDAESLVRYLLYGNQFHTEGLVATTSTWLRDKIHPEDMIEIIDAYGEVVENLNRHAPEDSPYPTAEYMHSILRNGSTAYGMAAVGNDIPPSEGAELLLERIQAESDQPLWVLAWGGTNVLAQALFKIENDFSPEEATDLRSRIRVYAISDQDDTGAWIRTRYPDVFYIASLHGWNQYPLATWSGISGDELHGFDKGGPDFSKLTHEWIRENIQVGPLGFKYPDYAYLVEGDTPSFLYLIQNGLGDSEHPEYGSWGGRYSLVNPSTHGLVYNQYSDVADSVVGADNRTHKSNHATIWRWRDAYQNDFAARIQWTLSASNGTANHHPVVSVNGSSGLEVVSVDGVAGSTLTFDASETADPDGDDMTFRWFQYSEPTAGHAVSGESVVKMGVKAFGTGGQSVQVQIPSANKTCATSQRGYCQLLHLVLEVTDSGTPALTSYRRVLIQVVKT